MDYSKQLYQAYGYINEADELLARLKRSLSTGNDEAWEQYARVMLRSGEDPIGTKLHRLSNMVDRNNLASVRAFTSACKDNGYVPLMLVTGRGINYHTSTTDTLPPQRVLDTHTSGTEARTDFIIIKSLNRGFIEGSRLNRRVSLQNPLRYEGLKFFWDFMKSDEGVEYLVAHPSRPPANSMLIQRTVERVDFHPISSSTLHQIL